MEIPRADIKLSLQRALVGEIYPNIRAIVFRYSYKTKTMLLRYYLDREPTDYDREEISCVMAEFISDFKVADFEHVEEECIFSTLPSNKLEVLDGYLFARKE